MSNVSTTSAGERGVNRDKPSDGEVPDRANSPKRDEGMRDPVFHPVPCGFPAPPA